MDNEVDNKKLYNILQLCMEARKKIAYYGYKSGRGHISSSLSLVEIMTVLYQGGYLEAGAIKSFSQERNRLILSKGHAGLGLYVALMQADIIDEGELEGFAQAEGKLSTHPVYGSIKGIELSAGSLGQGIGFAAGIALNAKMKGMPYHTYVIVGDGELQEGSNWESLMFVTQMQLDNFTLIVDRNNLQISGKVEEIVSLSPLIDKLNAFGCKVIEINGHDIVEIVTALNVRQKGKPKAIIANTVKGKGIFFIEGKNGWHGKGLTEEQYRIAMSKMEQMDNGKCIN